MTYYDDEVRALQAEAEAALKKELAARPPDPLRTERNAFLMRLVQIRLRKKLSQAELARRSNLQQPAIARIESGRGNPSLRTLLAIAKALDIDLMLEYKK